MPEPTNVSVIKANIKLFIKNTYMFTVSQDSLSQSVK